MFNGSPGNIFGTMTATLVMDNMVVHTSYPVIPQKQGLQEGEEEPYIEPNIRDSRGLILLYIAGQLPAGRVEIPRVRLPLAVLAATNLNEWQVFAAADSFQADGVGVPGGDSVFACSER